MTPELKATLLTRQFQSLEYVEQFISTYKAFLNYGLQAYNDYVNLPEKPVMHPRYDYMATDENLWKIKVIPNFLGMLNSADQCLIQAQRGNISDTAYLAGDFRGLSKDMDGIREAFMEAFDPSVKETYLSLWDKARTLGNNIYYTYRNSWKPGEILKETITGPIDENELLNYLKPGESVE